MKRWIAVLLLVVISALLGLMGYYVEGHSDALDDSHLLTRRANTMARLGWGPDSLGPNRGTVLLAVEDPATFFRDGSDLDAPAAGHDHMLRSLAKRLAFNHYDGGIDALRLDGYARGLGERLTKRQMLTLWIETVDMGEGPHGRMSGLLAASRAIYHKYPSELTDQQFIRLAAVIADPSRYRLEGPDPALDERAARVARLVSRACAPTDDGDLALAGCSAR